MVRNVCDGVSVRNELVAVTVLPALLVAVAVTVYCLSTLNAHWLRQTVPLWVSTPATGSPCAVTVTCPILPFATLTVMPWSGAAFLAPLSGLMDNWAAAAAAAGAAGLCLPAVLAGLPPPEQA